MTLLPHERRAVDFICQVSGEELLDHPGANDMLWLGIWQLDPVADDIIGDPENGLVDSDSSEFLLGVSRIFLLVLQSPLSNPVVFLSTEDLTEEADRLRPTDLGQSLDGLLDEVVHIVSEANSCPVQYFCALEEVLNLTIGIWPVVPLFLDGSELRLLPDKVLDLVDEIEGFLVRDYSSVLIQVLVEQGVLDLEVRLLYQ